MNQAILYLTNKTVPSILDHYTLLKKQADHLGNVSLLFHETMPAPHILCNHDFKVTKFNNSILQNLGYKPLGTSLLPGSNHFPLLLFYRQNPCYDYYWYIEDDVRYLPDWSTFFSIFDSEKFSFDFISSHLRDYDEEPGWCWWETLEYKSKQISTSIKVRSFNPIFRISNAALEFIHYCLSNGWAGHHEVVLPTLLKKACFDIADFGGVGRYVLPGCLNRFYWEQQHDIYGSVQSGSMRYRPLVNVSEMINTGLYHPFKDQLYL